MCSQETLVLDLMEAALPWRKEGRMTGRKRSGRKNAPSPTIYPVYGLDIKARQVEDWQKFNQISLIGDQAVKQWHP